MKGVRIDYTIYSPGYAPGVGECWDNRTLRGARKKARELGVGSLIVRNFNRNKPRWIGGKARFAGCGTGLPSEKGIR